MYESANQGFKEVSNNMHQYFKVLSSVALVSLLGMGSASAVEKERDVSDASVVVDAALPIEKIPAPIKDVLAKILPADVPYSVFSSPVSGFYQVVIGMRVVFISDDGKYMINGALIDINSRENITETASAAVRIKMLKDIPESSMIIFEGNKDGALYGRNISIFTDVDCPYCKKLHREVPQLSEAGITIRYLAYPRNGTQTSTYQDMVSIWCAKDQKAALEQALESGNSAQVASKCNHPVQDHMMYAGMFEVRWTPFMIFDNGQAIPGYAPAVEIINEMKK